MNNKDKKINEAIEFIDKSINRVNVGVSLSIRGTLKQIKEILKGDAQDEFRPS